MHQYFAGFDVLSEHQIEEIFPKNDVPDGLHFEDVDEVDAPDAFTETQFVQWLSEGRYDCEVAQTLLHAWTRFLKGTPNDALADFFHDLVHEASLVETEEKEAKINATNPLFVFLSELCS